MNWPLLLVGTHVLCFIVGGVISFVIFCLCAASSEDSRRNGSWEDE